MSNGCMRHARMRPARRIYETLYLPVDAHLRRLWQPCHEPVLQVPELVLYELLS